jgi:hypothetical protein
VALEAETENGRSAIEQRKIEGVTSNFVSVGTTNSVGIVPSADPLQLATLGGYLLALGQFVLVWNGVTPWPEGPTVKDGDQWNLGY